MMACLLRPMGVFLLFASFCGTAAAVQDPAAKGAERKPVPPLKIAAPKPPPSVHDGKDLKIFEGESLARAAREAVAEDNYTLAAQLQYWSVRKTDSDLYNLACYTTMAGDVEAGFYWLQEASLKEGVDFAWASRDTDLVKLRADPRWKTLAPYLTACNAYWAASGLVQTAVVLPKGYRKGTPIGVAVGLHGMGGKPSEFVDAELFQVYADELKMAIVAISGTTPRGPGSFVWSEDGEKDHVHIQKVLKGLGDRLTVDPKHVVLYGFSQGGQMAFEAAWLHPEAYRGALIISPGTPTTPRTVGLKSAPGNKTQGYVFVCGEKEAPGNVMLARQGDERARKGGAASELKLYEGVSQHSFPPDFHKAFVGWIKKIDGAKDNK